MNAKAQIKSEDTPVYGENAEPVINTNIFTYSEEEIIRAALSILRSRIQREHSISSPEDTMNYLKLTLTEREHEVFGCIFLDAQHRVIEIAELFRGTINGASVHAREVVKETLQRNAAAIIFYHNHPSGIPEPSAADRHLTRRLQEALEIIEVRVLDHVIIGGAAHVCFSDRGLI